ncbi:MAG: penicillin-binding protein 1C [Pseudomonadota bacterium]
MSHLVHSGPAPHLPTPSLPPFVKGGRGGFKTLTFPATFTFLATLLLTPPSLAAPLPTFQSVRTAHLPSEAWVLDRQGHILQSVRADDRVRRLPWITLGDLSPAMVQALIASEDRRFFKHAGVDWTALAAAAWQNLSGQSHRGASTLTMQLAGMLDPALKRDDDGRSVEQKVRQIAAARELEKRWSKAQILEAYLNLANFRGELAGIAAASKGLFGKHPSGLNRAEASLLSALLRGPNAKPDVVAKRACQVVEQVTGKADKVECTRITNLAWTALVRPPRLDQERQLAPHLARRLTLKPGQSLRTTLDADLQSFVLDTLGRHLVELADRQVEDGAVLVLDNATGQVLAWAGASEATSRAAQVDGVTAPRLPGSTLKPFLYGLALEQKLLTAASPLDDSPLALDTPLGQYVPHNYERDFKGWVSVRNALGASLNVPAVRTLELLGVDRFLAGLRGLGLKSLDQDGEFYGYALALGSGETPLLELANAYRALANGGRTGPVSWLPSEVAGKRGKPGHRALSAPAAWLVADILADKGARSLTFGLSSPLDTRGWSAVKTGTSKDMRDNWCLGFSDRHTVAVWVGNASGQPMRDVSGVTGAAPVWQAVMNRLQEGRPALAPKPPAGIEARTVRFEPPFEPSRREYFLAGTAQDRVLLPATPAGGTRIDGPGNGAVLARDPDIPALRQKVRFAARGAPPGMTWRIDGQPAEAGWLDTDGSLLWPPVAGGHRISLHDGQGKELEAQFVTVK